MIVVDNAAVRANRNVDAGLTEVVISRLRDLNNGRRLTSADALGLAGDADGAAADSNLHEIRTCLCEEKKTFAIHDVAGTDFDAVAVLSAYPGDGSLLPLRIAFGGVDAEHIDARLDQSRNAGLIVSRVDTGADNIRLVLVEELVHILLVAVVVLAEHHVL